MIKRLNIKNLIIIATILIVVHFGVGFFLSPVLSSFVVGQINKNATAKVSIGKVNIWPLTLSISLNDFKISDPDNIEMRIIKANAVSARIGILGLLSKRLVFSVNVNGAEINLQGEADGSFNIEKLSRSKEIQQKKPQDSIFGMASKKKDLFAKLYDILKARLSKKSIEKNEAEESKKNAKEVIVLPKGKTIQFKKTKESYLLEISKLEINNLSLKIKPDSGKTIDIEQAKLILEDFGFDPQNGIKISELDIMGNIKTNGLSAGKFNATFDKKQQGENLVTTFNLTAKEIDLKAVRSVYEESLPVDFVKGTLDLTSETRITNETIDSTNKIILKNHELSDKSGISVEGSFLPIPIICQTLNSINPVNLSFKITGTLDKPEFSGFQKSLMEVVKPGMSNFKEKAKDEGIKFIDNFLKGKETPKQKTEEENKTE